MKKIKIGVMGTGRGESMIKYCKIAKNAELVAICDNWVEALDRQKEKCKDLDITFYDNFDEFIKHDMDAVVLANFATEHAPFAIKAMKAGKHVYSEVLPCQTMKEAVELISKCGGISFLAHPHLTKLPDDELREFLIELKGYGLCGLEGYYTDYTPEMQEKYQKMAAELGLMISGGTDFHAKMKPHISIGTGLGNMKIPYSVLENMKKAL